jgi:hypothetical protein
MDKQIMEQSFQGIKVPGNKNKSAIDTQSMDHRRITLSEVTPISRGNVVYNSNTTAFLKQGDVRDGE